MLQLIDFDKFVGLKFHVKIREELAHYVNFVISIWLEIDSKIPHFWQIEMHSLPWAICRITYNI